MTENACRRLFKNEYINTVNTMRGVNIEESQMEEYRITEKNSLE